MEMPKEDLTKLIAGLYEQSPGDFVHKFLKMTESGDIKIAVSNSLISYQWSGVGVTNAPSATNIPQFTVGVDSAGISTGSVYHVISGNWVPLGATVANLFGG